MSVSDKDIRAAVSSNLISESQAVSLLALADARRGARDQTPANEEPFELFKGFNEIFIVVGLGVLYAGWLALTGLSSLGDEASIVFAVYGMISIAFTIGLANYFTLKRRMVAPSIMLVLFIAAGGVQVGSALSAAIDTSFALGTAFTATLTTILLGVFYWLFRIPVTMLFIALGVFTAVGSFFVLGGAGLPSFEDFFRLSGSGPFALITIGLGLVGLVIALWFDMSDPHRVTRRSSSGFWLHVIAAPAIVNTVALTLFEADSILAQCLLLLFLSIMALFAIIIDRRSFLVAGVGYVVGLAVVILEGGAGLAILVLGFGLVVLGAKWEDLRGAIMRALPEFPGKDKLPPWGAKELSQ